jgi:hypothetical protein
LFTKSTKTIWDILVFIAKKRVKRGYFSNFSTGEISVSTGPVDFLSRSGPAGPIPAMIGDERLSNMATIDIRNNVIQELKIKEIIDEFAKTKRRLNFTN